MRHLMFAAVGLFTVCGLLSACGSGTESRAKGSGNPVPVELPASKPSVEKPTFQYFGLIREFGGIDTAALFGVLPSHGAVQIVDVTGPAFLGTARVGTLDATALDHLFLNSAFPISRAEKDKLLGGYAGAQVIYFEKYRGNLCAGADQAQKISFTGSAGETQLRSILEFEATATADGDCVYQSFKALTQY